VSRTYAIMELSQDAYDEISEKLTEAGYDQAFHHDASHGTVIDMHGLAVAVAKPAAREDWTQRAGYAVWSARHGRQCGWDGARCPDRDEHRRGPAR
jgi:hypothetical protein